MQSFLKVALVRYMSTWCSLVNNLFSCCLINTILLCLTTYTLLFDSDLLFFKVQIHEPNPKYKNIWIGYIPKYQNSQFKPKHVFEHLPLHRKSIDSRFMQLEMSVSSTSLEEILPIKIPLHKRYSSVSFKSEKHCDFPYCLSLCVMVHLGLEGTTRHVSMRMEVLKVSTWQFTVTIFMFKNSVVSLWLYSCVISLKTNQTLY